MKLIKGYCTCAKIINIIEYATVAVSRFLFSQHLGFRKENIAVFSLSHFLVTFKLLDTIVNHCSVDHVIKATDIYCYQYRHPKGIIHRFSAGLISIHHRYVLFTMKCSRLSPLHTLCGAPICHKGLQAHMLKFEARKTNASSRFGFVYGTFPDHRIKPYQIYSVT